MNYWAIAPADYSQRRKFRKCWEYDLAHDIITVGWDVGVPASYEDLVKIYDAVPRHQEWTRWHVLNMLNKFWFGISEGDRIIARAGLMKMVGIGTVTGRPCFDQNIEGCTWGCNVLPVRWDWAGEEDVGRTFHRYTISKLTEPKFNGLIGAVG